LEKTAINVLIKKFDMFLSKNNRFSQFLLAGRASVNIHLRDQIIKKISKKLMLLFHLFGV
jgi:hypothetical protein